MGRDRVVDRAVTEGIPIGLSGRSEARTVTEAEMTVLASITGGVGPVHTDREHARRTRYGELTLGGALAVAFAVGLWRRNPLFRRLPREFGVTTTVGLGHKARYIGAIRAGDTIELESTVLAVRASLSQPGVGIMTMGDLLRNQHGDVVTEIERASLFERSPRLAE